MRCINKKRIKYLSLLVTVSISCTGILSSCAWFDKKEDSYNIALSSVGSNSKINNFLGEDLCVTDEVNFGLEKVSSDSAEEAGVFNVSKKEVTYNQNIYKKLYPASTTKILTAYIILKNSNLNDVTTVSENAVKQGGDSSVCHLKAGDKVSIKTLLHGMMLESGNDAAIALAEYYSNSTTDFAKVMNKYAMKLGATHTHFVNPNGLPADNHYTTLYDMYLIFNAAIKLPEFKEIVSTKEYVASYINSSSKEVSQTWKNTNAYLKGTYPVPDGFNIIGGKTGTTNAAGHCLVLYSKNARNEDIISIVYGGKTKPDLYKFMTQILTEFGK
ncbi:D-alanyl-D-alanine carboxypeptidase family protein [Lachnobacterium bovis]|uniref:D-alanyl-D-alanine carboxypeptidase (Penicillin-binding protein 5/6) n=1 Tax=Lachnobacterium bovis TaxID=140626 RepID=A0A1H9PYL7_9FIRM|nr:serine hydrolase [Lachnobacterium bovis]SER53282.1 D-alanyl-D-alanine carboxypeptidase (penicillin-binding protein 5/6) [Lachnobacterium bovis]